MPDNSIPENNVPEKRPSRFRQFGIRTLLVLVALAAFGCLLIRNEVVREARREELIAELEAQGATWQLFLPGGVTTTRPPRLWRESIAAWLHGKPVVPPRAWAMFPKGTSPAQFREFFDLFPAVEFVEIDGNDAMTEVLQSLAAHGPFDGVRFKNPMRIDRDKARLLAQIRCQSGMRFVKQEFSDASLKDLADAGVQVKLFLDDFWRNIGDEGLKAVAKSPHNSIVHAACRGTDEGARAFTGHPSLLMLFLTGRNYTDASADVIPTLPKLRAISFGGTGHTDAGLAKAITGCTARNIVFDNVAAGDQTIAALANIPTLNDVCFRDVDLSFEQCDALAKLPIKHLMIHNRNLSDEKIARLAPLAKTLTGLELKAPQVTDAGLAWLKQAKGLTTLRLDDTQATTVTWSSLPFLASLQGAGMGGPHLDAEMLAITSNMTSLTFFSLAGREVNDATLDLLPQGIESVLLVDTQVTPASVKSLSQRKGIKSISVFRDRATSSPITAADLKELQAVVGESVVLYFEDASWYRCD